MSTWMSSKDSEKKMSTWSINAVRFRCLPCFRQTFHRLPPLLPATSQISPPFPLDPLQNPSPVSVRSPAESPSCFHQTSHRLPSLLPTTSQISLPFPPDPP
uniref:Uncharacterized protein n=1 Tax=Chromera velia CCMP2878 TaxID=1169474 RepID=A0A0G4FQ39_9ALVE|eukprot:Cvel_18206.t1-p1 / transcript=Cvel_18206.t1 / gene=Cvel_18206 / organism=Chromera_velia_CCMP2878 / gene_product=hypothetical protein / transcript_product=hypothetical protein / location=Cvel_scaffold1494:35296-39891(+) / protein_length=100 / sequence_SO=supercontig / SO=protein_coding / is_pseudo=false